MRHGVSFVLVLFVVLFAVDDSLASILEQYILKDGREQCEELKPYCPPPKPKGKPKKKKPPPPKVKAKKKCKRQYRLRTSKNRCPFVKRPSCRKPSTAKKVAPDQCPKLQNKVIVDQGVKNTKVQSQAQCTPLILQKGSRDLSILVKEITTESDRSIHSPTSTPQSRQILCRDREEKSISTGRPIHCPTNTPQSRQISCRDREEKSSSSGRPIHCPSNTLKRNTAPQMSCGGCERKTIRKIECPAELPKIKKPCGVPKERTVGVPKCESSKMGLATTPCNKKNLYKEDVISNKPKCIKCPAELARERARIPSTTCGINCDNTRNLIDKTVTSTISPHFGHHDLNTGFVGPSKKQINCNNAVLEVKVPTMTQIARMGWNLVTFTTDQCVNIFTKIHESRERKRNRIY
ncbi:uncharacterized protein LOC108738548 [Agrilus planipennis]|uniref:Uncharacterized protein LOC108738548 n=1 Tax=Agrilus planipennis TaxID=224129 RepID=A0A1W4WUF8_AGRPL|nr:uncharacterized protein LOC108738548 [Agrilus planipennis]